MKKLLFLVGLIISMQYFVLYPKAYQFSASPGHGASTTITGKYGQRSGNAQYKQGQESTTTGTRGHITRTESYDPNSGYSSSITFTGKSSGPITPGAGYTKSWTNGDVERTVNINRGTGYTGTTYNVKSKKTRTGNLQRGSGYNVTVTGPDGGTRNTQITQSGVSTDIHGKADQVNHTGEITANGYSGQTTVNYDGQTYTHSVTNSDTENSH